MISRRALIYEVSRALALAGTALLALLGVRTAQSPTRRRQPLSLRPEDVAQPIAFADMLLVPTEHGQVRALSRRCTHLGCLLVIDAGASGFTCPCHGSRFDLQGHRIAGPARADLPRFEVDRHADGRISVR